MTTDERNFFPKSERLCLKKDVDRLLDAGQSFISYPFRIVYLSYVGDLASGCAISILVSVPKKRIKQAVKRNRIKRLIREAFRLNKNETSAFYKLNEKNLHIAFLYICNDMKTFTVIEKAILKTLEIIRRNEQVTKNGVLQTQFSITSSLMHNA